jgi:hypothetical protein
MISDQYSHNYQEIKWTRRAKEPRADLVQRKQAFMVIKDIEPFISPIDGNIVGSRSVLREHERRHSVRQIGNDWAGSERPDNWDQIRHGRN